VSWWGRGLVLLLFAVAAMTIVVSVPPLDTAAVRLVHCRGGDLVTERGARSSMPTRPGSPVDKGAVSVSATCTRADGSVSALSGDTMALTSIGTGLAVGAAAGAATMAWTGRRAARA
jgi:hypothetical protein